MLFSHFRCLGTEDDSFKRLGHIFMLLLHDLLQNSGDEDGIVIQPTSPEEMDLSKLQILPAYLKLLLVLA